MSFKQFLASIASPDLRLLAEHWDAVRGTKGMPGWSDIDPVALGRRLRYVWAWRYDRANDSFTGRLGGEEIDSAYGKSLRGASMREFFPPKVYEVVFPRHRRVAVEPALMHGTGIIFGHLDRMLTGERIILPLAADGVLGDGIIGATYYDGPSPLPRGDESPGPDFEPEQVTFFPLDPPQR